MSSEDIDSEVQIYKELAEQGFKQQPMTIRLEDITIGEFSILMPDGIRRELSRFEITSVLSGNGTLGAEVDDAIREWYPNSFYKKAQELLDLEDKWQKEKNLRKKIELAVKRKELCARVFSRDAFKKELGYLWGETGERLDKLYLIIHGDIDTENIKIGGMAIEIPLKQYTPELRQKECGSDGFFPDFIKTHNILKSLPDEIKAQATAKTYVCVGENFIELESLVMKQPGKIISNIRAGPIDLQDEIFTLAANIEYPQFETLKETPILRYNPRDEIGFHYMSDGKPQLILCGNPEKLETFAIRFIQKMLEYKK